MVDHGCCEKKCVWIREMIGSENKCNLVIWTFPKKRGSDVGDSQNLLRMVVIEWERIRWTIFSTI